MCPPIKINRMPKANIARDRSPRITLDFVFFEILAPICAPMAAPTEMQRAGSQMMWSSRKWETTPKMDEQARMKCEVAVATCTGKLSR